MRPEDKTGGIFKRASGFIRPGPGQEAVYKCRACGGRFTRKIPLLFGFGVRCPHCGSFQVEKDPFVVY